MSTGCGMLLSKHHRKDWANGYTLILPGIECHHLIHHRLAKGLEDGGVKGTIEVHDWTTGVAPLMLFHLRDPWRHERQAKQIAQKIVDYQTNYPGRPVNLIGHSGGGGIALMAADLLPRESEIQSVVLLNPAISPQYDLRNVLRQSRSGVWNFSSAINDSALLVAGTTVFGTVDGYHMPSAGALGFHWPKNMSHNDQWHYEHQLHEVPYRLEFLANMHPGGHWGAMTYSFSKAYIAPILVEAAK